LAVVTPNVTGNTALRYLYRYNNKFTDAGMTTLVNSLPTRSASSNGELRVLHNTSENNVFTSAHAATAAAKNWNPYRYNGTTLGLLICHPFSFIRFPQVFKVA